MKLRFLLFFILVFLLGSFSVKAQQDLVYNGKVEIIVKVLSLEAKNIDDVDSKDKSPDYRTQFYVNGNAYGNTMEAVGPYRKNSWESWTPNNANLPYKLYSHKFYISKNTLKSIESSFDAVTFKYNAWEQEGGHHQGSDRKQHYERNVEFTLTDIIKNDLSPGYHVSKYFTEDPWRVRFEYSITPPAPTIEKIISRITEEDSELVISSQDLGGNIKYEWQMNVDGKTRTYSKPTEMTDWTKYNDCIMDCDNSGGDLSAQRSTSLQKEIIPIGDGSCDEQCMQFAKIYEDVEEIVWDYPKDKTSNTNKTNSSTLTYNIPEFDGFTKNYKFVAYSYVEATGKLTLKSLDYAVIAIVDVFPHFPVIENVETTIVTCNINNINGHSDTLANQKDGKVNLKIKGDLDKGVDKYKAQLRKKTTGSNETDVTKWPNYGTGNEFKSDIITFDELEAGEYSVAVSNLFFHSDTIKFQEENPGKKILVGHIVKTFSVTQRPLVNLNTFSFQTTGNCEEYKIVDPVSVGGAGSFTYSLSEGGTYGAIGSLAPAVLFAGEEANKNASLYMKDKLGCLVKKEEVKMRNVQLDLELKIIDNVECFGEKGSVNIRAVGGVEPYTLINETNGNSLAQGTIAGFNAGTNDISITDDEGCSFEKPIVLNEPQKIEVYDFVNVKQYDNFDIKCHGASDGKVKFKVKGGLANGPDGKPNKYSYTISGRMNKSGDNLPPATDITLEGLEAGNYTLEISDANGCFLGTLFPFELKQPDVITIKNPEPKYINSIKDKFHFSCSDASEDISIEIHGGLPPYSATHSSSLIPIEKVGEVYKAKLVKTKEIKPILYVSDKGCINKERSVDLIKPLPLTVNFECSTYKAGPEDGTGEVYHIKKNGGNDKLDVIVEGGITPYAITFQKYDEGKGVWKLVESRSSSLRINKFDVTAGTYKAIVNGKYASCTANSAITLREPAKLELPITYHKTNGYDIACKDSKGAITVKPTGGIPPYALTVNGGVSLSFSNLVSVEKYINELPAGTYDLTLTDYYNIKLNSKVDLIEPEALTLDLATTTYEGGYQIKCSDLLGYVNVEPDGGVGSTYTIVQKCDLKSDVKKEDVSKTTFDNLEEGFYTYKLSDLNGCFIEESIDITKPKELTINFGAIKIPSCNEFDMGDKSKKEDGQIELTISGGATLGYKTNIYQSDGVLPDVSKVEVNGNSPVFNSLVEGEYKFITIDGNGCKVEETKKKLGQPDLLTLDVSKMMVTDPTCFDYSDGHWESKILGGTTATGQYTYEINGVGGSTGSTFNRNNLAAGKYIMEISDDNGCYYQLEKELKEPDFIINQLNVLGIDILKEGGVADFRCFGFDDKTNVKVNGGTANYDVLINKDGNLFQVINNVAEDLLIPTNNLGAGSYTILTTDSRGCTSDQGVFQLNQPTNIISSHFIETFEDRRTGVDFNYTCFGETQSIEVSVEGGIPPYQITYNGESKKITNSGSSVDFIISGTNPIFNIIDANDCVYNYDPILIEPSKLTLELSNNTYKSDNFNIKCFNGTDSIWAKATGGITPYTFELLDESNTLMASKESNGEVFFEDLPVGLYHVKVTGAYNSSCSAFHDISLKQPNPINANINLSDYNGFEIKCKGLTDTIKVEALGGISPYSIHLEGMEIEKEFTKVKNGQVIFSDLPAGKYQVSITDQFKACEYVKDTVLTEPTVLKFDIETSHYKGGFEIRCSYLKDSVKITPYGGLPITNASKYKIVQSDEHENHQLGNIIAGKNLAFKNLDAGMYSYIVSDDNGCSVSNIVTLVKPDSLQITDVAFTIPTCHAKDMGDISKRTDGEIKVQAIGGVNYSGGYYDFLLNKVPLAEAKDRLDSIRGISNATFIQRETGEYIIRVTDVNGCMTERNKQHLEQADWLHIESFNSVIPECYEAKDGFWTSEVLGGTSALGNYSFIISKDEQDFRNGTTGKEWNQDGLGKGKYLLEITDDLGCYYKQEEELQQPAEMAIDFDVMGVTDFGNNDGAVQARVSGGNGDYRYQWYHKGEKYSNGRLKKIEELYAGEYTVEVWDKNNCPYGNNEFGVANGLKKTAGVMEPGGKLTIVANSVKTSYYGAEDGVLEVSAVGGWPYAVWPGYEFSLNQGAWLVTSKFENLKAGLYQLRVKDSKGVKDSIEVVIEEPDEILMELEKSNCLCFNDESGSVRVSATGGTAPYTYAINYAVDFSKSNEFTDLKAGNYRVFVKDKLGNIQNQYIDVDEPEDLKVELSDLTHSTCNSSNGSVKIEITGGTPEYYINWGDFYPANKLQPNTLATGNYKIEVTDANSCVASQSFSIVEKSGPEISLIDLKEVSCHESTDGEISIDITNGTEPYDVIWKGLESLNPREIKQLGKGKYSLVVSDANNCFAEAEYEITGPEELELYVSSLQSPNCVGIDDGSILLTAVGGSPDYIYNLNGKSNINGWFPNLGAGDLQIEVTDANVCKKTLEAELSAPVPVKIELPYEYVLCRNQTETVNSGVDGASSKWFFGGNQFSVNNEVELNEEGDYRLVVTTEKGCEAEHEFAITFLDYEVVADFIIPVEAIVGDTIVAVDISWEQPDSVKWHFPDGLEVVNREEASIWLRVLEAGNHTIGMSIFKNECSDYMEKQVRVESNSTKRKAGFIQPDQVYITEAKLYPNPNRGDFHLKLLLSKTADVSLEIYDVERALKIDTDEGHNNAVYQFDFNNRSIFRPNNVYAVVIIVGKERRVLRFLVY
ncbi:SprB repeat-containing protein [Labilibaculum euxinus]